MDAALMAAGIAPLVEQLAEVSTLLQAQVTQGQDRQAAEATRDAAVTTLLQEQVIQGQQRLAAETARDAAAREEREWLTERRAVEKQQLIASFRVLSEDDKKAIQWLKKVKEAPGSVTWGGSNGIESWFRQLCEQRWRALQPLQRRELLSEMLAQAHLRVVESQFFTGADTQLQPGALWMMMIIKDLGLSPPTIFSIDPPSAGTKLATHWESIKYQVMFTQACVARSSGGNAELVWQSVIAVSMLASVEESPENVQLRAALGLVGGAGGRTLDELCNAPHYRATKLSWPLNLFSKGKNASASKYLEEVTAQKENKPPALSSTSASTNTAAPTAVTLAGAPLGVVQRVRHALARVWMRVSKPKGEPELTSVVIDPASSVTLVSEEFMARASGVVAQITNGEPLRHLQVAGGQIAMRGGHGTHAVILELGEVGSEERVLVEAYVVPNLPCDLLAGVDTLGPAMGGTRVDIDQAGVATVTFGDKIGKSDDKVAEVDVVLRAPDQERRAVVVAGKRQVWREPVRRARGAVPAPAPTATDTPATAPGAGVLALMVDVRAPDGTMVPLMFDVLSGLESEMAGVEGGGTASISVLQRTMIEAAAEEMLRAQADQRLPVPSGGETVLLEVARAAETGLATVMMSVNTLDEEGLVPEMDSGVPHSLADGRFKFSSATDKLLDMVDKVTTVLPGQGAMPKAVRDKLKWEIGGLGAPLASKEAPHRVGNQFIDDADAVLRLRFRPDAQLDLVRAVWRPMQPAARAALDAQVAEWRRIGVMVRPKVGEAQCVSLPIVVPKLNQAGERTGWRVAIDTRRLNDQLLTDRYAPEPRLAIARRVAESAAAVTVIDCAALFIQFRVVPEHQKYLMVQTAPGVLDKLTAAPFGVSQMPGIAQHWMEEKMVRGEADKDVFIDDLIISHPTACTWAQAAEQLMVVLRRAKTLNLALNVDKMILFSTAPVVLGYQIDCETHSFKPNPPKMQIIMSMTMPSTNKSLERAINMAAAWAHALPGLQMLTRRLRAMVVVGVPLVVTEDGRRAWAALVALLGSSQAMKAWDETKPVKVWTDACASGLAWCVTQEHEGKEWLVQAGGRKTLEFERRLSIPELEALAVRLAFQQAPDLLVEAPAGVEWLTDSQAIALARGQKSEIKSRAVRQFMIELAARNFGAVTIKKVAGKFNTLADALSRQWEEEDREVLAVAMMTTEDGDSLIVPVGVSTSVQQEEEEEEKRSEAPTPELRWQVDATDTDDDEVRDEPPTRAVPAPIGAARTTAAPIGAARTTAAPIKSGASSASTATTTASTSAAAPTQGSTQADEIEKLLVDDAVIDRVAAERRRWAHLQAQDSAGWMRSMRDAQKGQWVRRSEQRHLVVQADATGRLFVLTNGIKRLVVPDSEMASIMHAIHSGVAHKKVETMVAEFERHFFNPHTTKVAKTVIEDCLACQQVDPRRADRSRGTDPTAWARFEMVSFDVFELRNAGPFQYGLLVVDTNTGMFEVTPMMSHTAADVERALREGWLARWPCPTWWKSDNAQELIGKAMERLEIEKGIGRVQSAVRNPRGNGVVERQIGLFKLALRKITPIGADWTDYVAQARYGLICSVSQTRGYSPLELATGAAPTVVGAAGAQVDREGLVPDQGGTIKEKLAKQKKELVSKLAALSAAANRRRLDRNKSSFDKTRQAAPQHAWKVGDVVWLDDVPFDKAGKWDQKIRRSRALVIGRVDHRNRRLQVLDFETRLPFKGEIPFHLISPVKGKWARSPEGTEIDPPKQKQMETTEMMPLAVPCEFGFIMDVTETTDGRVVLLAGVNANGEADREAPMMQVAASSLPAKLVQEAWRAKHLLQAPAAVKKAVQRQQRRKDA